MFKMVSNNLKFYRGKIKPVTTKQNLVGGNCETELTQIQRKEQFSIS